MKKSFLLFLILCCFESTLAQKNLIPPFIRRMIFEKDSSKRSSFIPLPVLGYSQEKGLEAGLSGLFAFYTDTVNKGTRVSDVFTYATLTTKGQSRFGITTSFWRPKNTWHFTTYTQYINYPFTFYGVGDATHAADAESLGEHRFKFNLGAERLIAKSVYAGILTGLYNYSFSSSTPNGILETAPNIYNQSGGSGVFIGPSLIIDTRNSNTYTTTGLKFSSSYSILHGIFGSNNYSGGLLAIQYDQFFKLNKKWVLAFDAYDNSLFDSQSPFYLLPTLGNDERMRGYYNGRYRDNNYVAAQTELRFRFTDRFGLVGFAGTGTVFNTTFDASKLKPELGGGVRYFFDVEKGISIRLDYGIGEQRPGESRQSGFYASLGEAF